MKPIHRYNNTDGLTLCRNCRAIIAKQLTDALYCNKCKGYDKEKQTS